MDKGIEIYEAKDGEKVVIIDDVRFKGKTREEWDEIEKGENSFAVDIEENTTELDFKKPIYCYLFTGKNVLDKTAIKCDSVVIK